ncbi:hypothetical protein [Paenibacillus sp. UNC499MF]|uniref:hypothetical protein n=1 Tax=Paenibacillus sp. UNC499MF TaxID=1502751 RepID=UPI0008A01472|nr:hypothetical protein [Paenibacillus sp. UNC499MF]SEG60155.1 hypothetical protein SAMN02799616_03753 [Paenibacillus sp. UNC499MF]
MDSGLLSLIVMLTFGALLYTMFNITTYTGWKKRHDEEIAQKIDRILDLIENKSQD